MTCIELLRIALKGITAKEVKAKRKIKLDVFINYKCVRCKRYLEMLNRNNKYIETLKKRVFSFLGLFFSFLRFQ